MGEPLKLGEQVVQASNERAIHFVGDQAIRDHDGQASQVAWKRDRRVNEKGLGALGMGAIGQASQALGVEAMEIQAPGTRVAVTQALVKA
ncbi:unnamed protein product, partial [Ilex paraguariensis]